MESIEIVTPDHEDALSNLASLSGTLVCTSSSSPLPRYSLALVQRSKMVSTTIQITAGQISNEDLPRIGKKKWRNREGNFHQSVKKWLKTKAESSKKWSNKLELIEEHSDDEGGFTTSSSGGEYAGPCRGPHVPSTGRIQIFHLQRSKSYWRGNSWQRDDATDLWYWLVWQERLELQMRK